MIQREIVPGLEFQEEVIRPVRTVKGNYTGEKEVVVVEQVYNINSIKIRRQCSSCAKYWTTDVGKTKQIYCPNAIVHLSGGRSYTNGRGICDEYQMHDVYKIVGSGPFSEKVKCPEFVAWTAAKKHWIDKMWSLEPVGQEFVTWRRRLWEQESGMDVYGKML